MIEQVNEWINIKFEFIIVITWGFESLLRIIKWGFETFLSTPRKRVIPFRRHFGTNIIIIITIIIILKGS